MPWSLSVMLPATAAAALEAAPPADAEVVFGAGFAGGSTGAFATGGRGESPELVDAEGGVGRGAAERALDAAMLDLLVLAVAALAGLWLAGLELAMGGGAAAGLGAATGGAFGEAEGAGAGVSPAAEGAPRSS